MTNTVSYRNVYNDLTSDLLSRLNTKDKNLVLSPLSILTLLAIAADAANGKTKEEILNYLSGKEDTEDLIETVASIGDLLGKDKALNSANAVCIRKDLEDKVVPEYPKRLKEIFDGELFSSDDIVTEVNRWVKGKTKGMIEEILDEKQSALLAACLLNAVSFVGKWQTEYEDDDVDVMTFFNADRTRHGVVCLHSEENKYIKNDSVKGFIKPYKDIGYSFMALLPEKNRPAVMSRTLRDLDLSKTFESAVDKKVYVTMPEFKIDFSSDLTTMLKDAGIETAFTADADLSNLADTDLYIDQILHKAHIEVDRQGTKAAAVTTAFVCAGALPEEFREVTLDRPFIYAVIHNETKLPAFVGVVNCLEDNAGSEFE